MDIHFCDLCNESVPQSDLDIGKAFMRKGRVVCAQCDRLMSVGETASSTGPFGSGIGSAAGAVGAGAAAGTAVAGAPGAATEATGAAGQGPARPGAAAPHAGAAPQAPAGYHARPQVSGAGVGMGFMAILLSGAAAFFVYDRGETARADLRTAIAGLGDTLERDHDATAERLRSIEDNVREMGTRLEGQLTEQRRSLDASTTSLNGDTRDALAKVADLSVAVGEIREGFNSLRRHDDELLAIQRRLSGIGTELTELGRALANLETEMLKRPLATGGPAPAVGGGELGQPPWIGLVKDLESQNSGDRWNAVQALGETRDPEVAEFIVPRLEDTDIFVRMASARVLGDLDAAQAVGALIDALEDDEAPVREAAYDSLVRVTKKSLAFDPHADAGDRAKRVKAWRDWFKKENS